MDNRKYRECAEHIIHDLKDLCRLKLVGYYLSGVISEGQYRNIGLMFNDTYQKYAKDEDTGMTLEDYLISYLSVTCYEIELDDIDKPMSEEDFLKIMNQVTTCTIDFCNDNQAFTYGMPHVISILDSFAFAVATKYFGDPSHDTKKRDYKLGDMFYGKEKQSK